VLEHILDYLADPKSSIKLSLVYEDSSRLKQKTDADPSLVKKTAESIRKCIHLEDYLWPVPGSNWLERNRVNFDEASYQELSSFRDNVRRWQESVLLPVDQIILSLAQDFFEWLSWLSPIRSL
jgi:DNA helicase-2/ATP-dependent DNA helicase PcrA